VKILPRLGIIMLIMGLMFVCSSIADLALYFSFDEGEGDVTNDRVKGIVGSLVDNPKWVEGKFGNALEFDGKGAKVEVKKGEDPEPQNEISIAVWIKLNSSNGNFEIVRKQTPNGKGYDIRLEGSTLRWWVNVGDWMNSGYAQLIPANEWVFLTGTFDGKLSKIYINGDEVAKGDIDGKIQYDDSDLLIGSAAPHDANFNLDGALDEFMIWDNALTQDEIKTIMEKPFAVMPNGKLSTTWGYLRE